MTAKKGNPQVKRLLRRVLATGGSLGDVARHLHLDRSTITHWRDGSTKRVPKPVVDALETFALTLEVRQAVAAAREAQHDDSERPDAS